MAAIAQNGALNALYDTFNISAFTWLALYVCYMLLLREPHQPASRADLVVAACGLGAFMAPMSTLSWIALTGTESRSTFSSSTPIAPARLTRGCLMPSVRHGSCSLRPSR